jgi:NAD(P)-dependent dehydrogenase (short-subunit alcohol dehydrogenase family)
LISNEEKEMRLYGKRAVVTGGTTGIGYATAKAFLVEGAKVAITGRDMPRLQKARAELANGVVAVQMEARSVPGIESAATEIKRALGGVDVLFINAGVAFGTPCDTTSEERFDELMDVNFKAVFFTLQKFLPLMAEGSSVILNTSWLNEVGTPGLSVLSASKAAVRSLARTISAELLPRRIRINAISPGAIDTPIHGKTGMNPEQLAGFAKSLMAKIPLGQFGRAEDIAHAAVFLASDESKYMLGAEIVVDGGFSQI